MKESLLRWFGHMQRRPMTIPVRQNKTIQAKGVRRTRKRPNLTWVIVIRKDMIACNLITDITLNRTE